MQDKILSVFYGEDRLPYKDASRETHYPIVNGNVFNGANNVTKIRYYLDRIGGFLDVTWVVVSKLPNGQLASEVLNSNQAVYDEELGEHYIDFEISSYYTTLKGDVYLSLQGYQGGVEMEQDEDTGIYSIYGTPTIQATGSIKIGVNYAPQIVQGTHFTTSDLQQVLGLISEKANVDQVVLNFGVIPNDTTLSQLYGLVNSSNKPCVIDFGGYKFGLIAWLGGSNYSFEFNDVRGIGRWVGTSVNASTLLTDIFTTTSTYYKPYATTDDLNNLEDYIDDNYAKKSDLVYTRGSYQVVDITTTTIGDIYSNVDTSETFNVGGSNLLFRGTYLLEKGSNLGSNYNFKITCIEHDSVDMIGRYWQTTLGGIAPTTTLSTIFANLTNIPTTKGYVDSVVSTLKANAFQVVESLPATGQEGIIYLVETSSGVYEQYIWEGSDYIDLGTTQIDLSGYVQKTTSANKVYATDNGGNQTTIQVDDFYEGNIARRDSDNSITVPLTPTQNGHAASKGYVDTELNTKQDTLVSGTNIKTLNGTSLLGSGDIEYDSAFDEESTNALQNQVISKEIKELNYELAIIREELFEVLLTELDYKVSYAMNYAIPDSLSDSDGTHRVVYSETMLKDVEGNGVASNQEFPNGNFAGGTTGWRAYASSGTISVNNNILTVTAIANTSGNLQLISYYNPMKIIGHKYLISFEIKPSKTISNVRVYFGEYFSSMQTVQANIKTKITVIGTATNTTTIFGVGPSTDDSNIVEGDTVQYSNVQLIDLTQMFGAGNEPTTTSDNRIQWLLSLGYVPYNTGSLENTTISGIKLVGNNRLSLDRTQGDTTGWSGLNTTPRPFEEGKYYVGLVANNYFGPNAVSNVSISSNSVSLQTSSFGYGVGLPVRVKPSVSYTLSFNTTLASDYRIGWYDINGNPISNVSNSTGVFTSPSNAYCGVILLTPNTLNTLATYSNITLHLTSANIGYKPYTETTISLPQTTLLGALNSHDTLSVVEGNVVEGEQLYDIVHTVNTGNIIYNGTEGRKVNSIYRTLGDYTQFNLSVISDIADLGGHAVNKALSNLVIQTTNVEETGIVIYSYQSNKWAMLTLPTLTASTVEQANTWLSNHNVVVNYQLATPTQTIVAQDLHFDQVSSVIEQGGTIEPIFEDVPPNITTTFVVKKAVGE